MQTILLAEDDPGDVFLMRRALQKANVSNPLQVVGDGEAAILYIQGNGKYADRAAYPLPAIMLLDLNMPKKTGFEVLEWVRAQNGLRRLPVIILSTSCQEHDIRKAYDMGANSYMTKPTEFEKLVDMMKFVELNWLRVNVCPPLDVQFPTGTT